MKPQSTLRCFILAAGSSLLAISSAHAVSGNWSTDNTGNWSQAFLWSSNPTVPGTAAGDVIGLNFNVTTASRIVTINTTSRIAGVVNIGDPNNTTTYTVASSGGAILTMNNSGSPAQINETGSRTDTFSTNITLADNLAASVDGSLTISGIISESGGAKTLSKSGAGTLTLSNANTYSGTTTISAGTIAISSNNALGATGTGNTTTIASDGTANSARLSISGGITSAENITLTGISETGIYRPAIANASGTNTLSGNIILNGTGANKIQASTGTLNLTGNISQTGTTHGLTLQADGATSVMNVSNGLAINGATLLLVGNNTTPGGVINLSGGGTTGTTTLAMRAILRLGATNALTTNQNLTFGYTGTTAGEDVATFDLWSFNQTINVLNSLVNSANASANSSRIVTNGVAGTSILTLGNGNGSGTFAGQINSSTGNIQLIKTGTGNQTLGDTNSYTGGTRIDDGTLTLGHATDTLADTGAVNVNGGTLALGTRTDTVGAVTLTSGSITGSGAGTLTGTGSAYDVRSGTVSAKLGGSVGLTKSTTGIVTLSGVNDYTGATAVDDGTLLINGSTSITSTVNVGVSGTLGGTGTVGGNTTISGIHSPGNSPGIQTFTGNLSYVDAGTPDPSVRWELTNSTTTVGTNPSANFDQIIVGGNLDFANTTTIDLVFNAAGSSVLWSDTLWDSNQSWLIYDVAGTTFNFANLDLTTINWLDSGSNLFSTTGGSFSLGQNGEDVVLNYTIIPEPGAALLGSLGLLFLLRRRR